MEERHSILSLIYYEEQLVKSYNCYLLDDDLIEITLTEDGDVIGSIQMNSNQLKSIISILDDSFDDSIEIDDIPIKKSFLKNLESICE